MPTPNALDDDTFDETDALDDAEPTDADLAAEEVASDEPTEEPTGEEIASDEPDDATDDDDAPPPPPSRAAPPAPASRTSAVKPLPQGFVPLPVLPVGDPRIPADVETLAEAAICAAVFRRLAEHAEAHVAHILASDEEMPPFYLDDEDRDLLAALFAKDTALAARIRLAAGSVPRAL